MSIGPAGLPNHLSSGVNAALLPRLRAWADGIAGFYGAPVYLVGSALQDGNDNPRDWDIRVELPDEDFTARFGDAEAWTTEAVTGQWGEVRWRWSAECVKRTRDAWAWTGVNVDFQIYPLSHAQRAYGKMPRLRLDAMPSPAAPRGCEVAR